MSSTVIIVIAVLAFLAVSEIASAWAGRSVLGRRATSEGQAVTEQLQSMQTTLSDIRDRVAAIEGILQQVE